jgi:hypothetical protein
MEVGGQETCEVVLDRDEVPIKTWEITRVEDEVVRVVTFCTSRMRLKCIDFFKTLDRYELRVTEKL